MDLCDVMCNAFDRRLENRTEKESMIWQAIWICVREEEHAVCCSELRTSLSFFRTHRRLRYDISLRHLPRHKRRLFSSIHAPLGCPHGGTVSFFFGFRPGKIQYTLICLDYPWLPFGMLA